MKVELKDFLNWMYAVHNYQGGGNEAKNGQRWEDGVTEFIVDAFDIGDVLHHIDEYEVSIETPVMFHNRSLNRNRKAFKLGYQLAEIEKRFLDSIVKKEFNKLMDNAL
jgi:hypothetical protein